MTILLVEDDAGVREMVTDFLTGEGYTVLAVADGEAALAAFSERVHLVLLDLMLPKMSGLSVLKALRQKSVVPVIILTAKGSDADKMMGLGLGADDYLTKPFSLVELAARVKAQIRRATVYTPAEAAPLAPLHYRDLVIDDNRHAVLRNGQDLGLTRTEYDIVRLLASHPGQAFSKEQLYESVWQEPYYGNQNVLTSHINRLRAKLGEGDYIKTLWGIGYKMEAEE